MRIRPSRAAMGALALLWIIHLPTPVRAGEAGELLRRIRETPPHSVPVSTWRGWAEALQAHIAEADAEGNPGRLRELALFTAHLQAREVRDISGGLATLRDARRRLRAWPEADARALFLLESELLSRLGDREAIRRLMGEYRESPYYRPAPPGYSGGRGPGDPLRVTRPHAAGFDDPILTAMDRHLRAADTSPGEPFPTFEVRDIDGRVHRLEDYRGRWILLDAWAHGATPWHAEQQARARAWERWNDRGFVLIGLCQNLDAAGLRRVRQEVPGMAWPLVDRAEATPLLRRLGIFGEITTILIGPDGHAVARGLRTAEWADVLARSLGEPAGPRR